MAAMGGAEPAMSQKWGKGWSLLVVALGLALLGGCAKPDWIERTLVTVDVTGAWQGISEAGVGGGNVALWLDLRQEGPKVTGSARPEGGLSRSIEGTVAGDMFSFKSSGAAVTGEMTVSGDKMRGDVVVQTGTYTYKIRLLQRIGPSRLDSPPR
jgi:hypothetical protein